MMIFYCNTRNNLNVHQQWNIWLNCDTFLFWNMTQLFPNENDQDTLTQRKEYDIGNLKILTAMFICYIKKVQNDVVLKDIKIGQDRQDR